MARDRRVVIMLGMKGMGKTRLLNLMIDRYPAAAGSVRALDRSHQWAWGEWPGRGKALQEWLQELMGEDKDGRPLPSAPGKHRGLLVLDDADRYLTSSSAVGDLFRDLWLANRHYQMDLAVTAHRPQGIPKDLINAADEIWIFPIGEPRALDYLREIPALERAGLRQLPERAGVALRVRANTLQEVTLFPDLATVRIGSGDSSPAEETEDEDAEHRRGDSGAEPEGGQADRGGAEGAGPG